MKTYKTVSVDETYVDEVICDICGKKIDCSAGASEVKIISREGQSYPDSSAGTIREIDCCIKCFNTKVIPLLEKELKCKFSKKDYDYDYYYTL